MLLALCMVLSFMPTLAFADNGESAKEFSLDDGFITIKVAEESNFAVVSVDGEDTKEFGEVVITQSSATTTNHLEIFNENSNYTLKVVLRNVNIDVEDYTAVLVNGYDNVVIELDGNNTLKSGAGYAGIEMWRLLKNTPWVPSP